MKTAVVLAALCVNEGKLNVPTREIVDGVHMPMAGFGTWQYNSAKAEKMVLVALNTGIRNIDTAFLYGNQDGVGNAIRQSGIPREEIFITSKVNGGEGEQGTVNSHEYNLNQLGMTYVDLLLVHYPGDWYCRGKCSREERQASWRGLERLQKAGKARAIGVSHYCTRHIQDVLDINTIPIAVNQKEWHVGMGPDPEGVRSFCDRHNITFQSFSPLCGPCHGSKELINGTLVTDIGNNHGKSGPQVALKWLVENGSPVISKSSNPEHIRSNMELFDWNFTAEEFARLNFATTPAKVTNDCKVSEIDEVQV